MKKSLSCILALSILLSGCSSIKEKVVEVSEGTQQSTDKNQMSEVEKTAILKRIDEASSFLSVYVPDTGEIYIYDDHPDYELKFIISEALKRGMEVPFIGNPNEAFNWYGEELVQFRGEDLRNLAFELFNIDFYPDIIAQGNGFYVEGEDVYRLPSVPINQASSHYYAVDQAKYSVYNDNYFVDMPIMSIGADGVNYYVSGHAQFTFHKNNENPLNFFHSTVLFRFD